MGFVCKANLKSEKVYFKAGAEYTGSDIDNLLSLGLIQEVPDLEVVKAPDVVDVAFGDLQEEEPKKWDKKQKGKK